MDFSSTNTGDCHLNPWILLASKNCCGEFNYLFQFHFLLFALNLLLTELHSMPLFLAPKLTLNKWFFFLQVTHSFKVFTCWVLSIIARASAISFWLTPQRFATFVWHLWWTFMPHAERKNKRCQDNKGQLGSKGLTSVWVGTCAAFVQGQRSTT